MHFSGSYQASYKKSQSSSFSFDNEEEDTLDAMTFWMYGGGLSEETFTAPRLCQLWMLGRRLKISRLENDCIDALMRFILRNEASPGPIMKDMSAALSRIFANADENQSLIDFVIECACVYGLRIVHTQKQKLKDDYGFSAAYGRRLAEVARDSTFAGMKVKDRRSALQDNLCHWFHNHSSVLSDEDRVAEGRQ